MTTVVVATSGSAACDRAVRRAAEVFAGAELVVATAVPGSPTDPGAAVLRATLDDLAVDAAAALLARTCAGLRAPARAVVLRGDPVEALCDAAGATSADAIVVGSLGGMTGLGIGAELARRAPCPVVELGATSA